MAESKISIELVDATGGRQLQGGGATPAPSDSGRTPSAMSGTPQTSSAVAGKPQALPTDANSNWVQWARDIVSKSKSVADTIRTGNVGRAIDWNFGRPPAVESGGRPPVSMPSGGAAAEGAAAEGEGEAAKAIGGLGKAAKGAGIALAAVVVASKLWDTYVDYRAKQINADANLVSATLANRGEGRRQAEMEQIRASWKHHIPFRDSILGVDNADLAAEKGFRQNQADFRRKTADLSMWNPDLARTMITGEIDRQRRNISESKILGGKLNDLEQAQQRLDAVKQQVAAAEAQKAATDQLREVNERLAAETKKLNESMEGLTEAQKEAIRNMGKNVDTPMQQLAKHGFHLPDEHGNINAENARARRMRDAGLRIPLL